MKKIYTLIGAMAFVVGASAQYSQFSDEIKEVRKHDLVSSRASDKEVHGQNLIQNRAIWWSDDFSNAANWTTVNGPLHTSAATNPGWEIVTAIPSSLTSQGANSTLNSTSGGNFGLIDSDAAGGSATQDSYLEWAGTPIDLSGAGTTNLMIEFENYHRVFYETHSVELSVDGGSSWVSYEVNTQYGADVNNYQPMPGSNNPEVVRVRIDSLLDAHIAGGGNLTNLSVRFHYEGQWDWFWAVDDIRIVDVPADEAELVEGRVGAATPDPIWGDHINYYKIPVGQIDPNGYVAYGTAFNFGSNDQTNAEILAVVDDGATQTTVNGAGMASWVSEDTLRDTTSAFNPAASGSNTYDWDVQVSYDNIGQDDNTANNNSMWQFQTLDGGGLQEYGRTPDDWVSGTWNGDDGSGTNYAYTVCTQLVPNASMDVGKIRVAFHPNTVAGALIYPVIYELDPAAPDFQSLFGSLIYDGSSVANGEYTIQSGDISTQSSTVWVDLPLTSTVTLNPGSAYAVGFGYYGGPEACLVATNGTYPANAATNFIYDAVGNNSQNSIQWFWTANSLMIRAITPSDVSVEEMAAEGISLGQNIPNPTTGNTRIPYSLEVSGDVTLEIVDVTGKVVRTIDKGTQTPGNYNIFINGEDLSEGVYFYTMTVGQKRVTKRMVVTK